MASKSPDGPVPGAHRTRPIDEISASILLLLEYKERGRRYTQNILWDLVNDVLREDRQSPVGKKTYQKRVEALEKAGGLLRERAGIRRYNINAGPKTDDLLKTVPVNKLESLREAALKATESMRGGEVEARDRRKARTQAEEKVNLETIRTRQEKHVSQVLAIYQKWSETFLSHVIANNQPYTWGSTSLGDLHISGGLVSNAPYYQEAREDLRRWPRAYELLITAESALAKSNKRSSAILAKALAAVGTLMSKHGLGELFTREGGINRKGFVGEAIVAQYFIRKADECERFREPTVEWVNAKSVSVIESNGQTIATLVDGVTDAKEGTQLVGLFRNFEEEFNRANRSKGTKRSDLVVAIKKAQTAFSRAEKAYALFTSYLRDPVVKELDAMGFPSGPGCQICRSLGL